MLSKMPEYLLRDCKTIGPYSLLTLCLCYLTVNVTHSPIHDEASCFRFCNSASYDFHACNHLSGLPSWLSGQESACNAGDSGSIPVSGRFLWRRKWQPTPVFLPGDPMDRGVWQATVHGVTKSQI